MNTIAPAPRTLTASPELAAAIRRYITDRDGGIDRKDENTEAIFAAAQAQFGDSLVYVERVAGMAFFYVRHTPEARATAYDIQMRAENEEVTKGFTVLNWCEWANETEL